MSTPDATAIEDLLRHREWVRSLAASLVDNRADADDAAQEVWVRALRAPPPGVRSARAWLGRVLRSVIVDHARSDGRRRAREDLVRGPSQTESVHDVVARAEALRGLVSAVLALPEPHREAVLLRFFDDLPPREIGARMGVSAETARKRVQRGLAALRAALAEDSGRDVRAVLAPLLVPSPRVGTWTAASEAARITGGAAMGSNAKVGLVAALLLLLIGGGVALTLVATNGIGDDVDASGQYGDAATGEREHDDGASGRATRGDATHRRPRDRVTAGDGSSDHPVATTRGSSGDDSLAEAGESAGVRSGREDEASAAASSSSSGVGDSDPGLRLTGTIVDDASGEPVANALVVAVGVSGAPDGTLTTRTAADGGFSFSLPTERPVTLHVGGPVYLRGEPFAYRQLVVRDAGPGGEPVELRLERGLSITGRLVDDTGAPITRPVVIRATGQTERGDSDHSRSRAFAIQGDGSFELPGLEPGFYDLTVMPSGDGTPWAGTAVIRGVRAGDRDVHVRLGRAATIAGRMLASDGGKLDVRGGWLIAVPHGTEEGGPGTVWIPFSPDGKFESPPLDETLVYDVVAGAIPGFMRAQVDDVAPGAGAIAVTLPRARHLRGIVRDAQKRGVPNVPVRAAAEGVASDLPGAVSFAFSGRDGTFSIEGLGDHTFRVAAGGGNSYFRAKETVRDVAADTVDIELEIVLGEVVSGHLLDAAGNGVRTPSLRAARDGVDQMESNVPIANDDGSFAIRSLFPGTYRLYALVAGEAIDLGTVTAPAADLELRIPVR